MAAATTRKPWWQRVFRRLAVAVAVFVAVTAFSAWRAHNNAGKQLEKYTTGDCLILTQKGLGVEDTEAPCGADPSYMVVSHIDGNAPCPNDNYVTFETTAAGDTVGKLCLVDNLVPGHCYRSQIASQVTELVACDRGSSLSIPTFKVVSRHETGDAACEQNQVTIAYPEPSPGRTYCTAAP